MPITTIDEESPTKLKGLFEGTELQCVHSPSRKKQHLQLTLWQIA
jgi:hypothetical protein